MITSDLILKALGSPRKLRSLLAVVDPGGNEEALQSFLMTMRERGQVRFDVRKGQWSRF